MNIKSEEESLNDKAYNLLVHREREREWLRTRTVFADMNVEGEYVVRFAQAYYLAMVNTFFQKQ